MRMRRTAFIMALMTVFTVSLFAQSRGRNYIKQNISEWGGCRNVAITDTGGDLALNGKNDWIKEGIETHGQLWAAHLTNDACVLCFENGYKFLGNVPQKLKDALKATKYDVYRIKFTKEGSYFFADQEGHYTFWM